MSWRKIIDVQPDPDCEVILFSGVVQNTTFKFVDEGMGWYWDSHHDCIDDLIAVSESDQWQYLTDIAAPDA